jgi:hypothetical protein
MVNAANLRFELTDHLGTVRAVITGEKTGEGNAKILSLVFEWVVCQFNWVLSF